jgi:D-3-phosphoglycerate dehydrogenase
MRLAILDDYQRVALGSADWERLRRRGVEITVFHEAFASEEQAAERLAPFEVLCLMRERTAFPRSLIERLPRLRFVTYTGTRSPSLDAAACAARGIAVSHTRGGNGTVSTAELTWGLIIAAARNLARAERTMRAGGWHEGVAPGSVLEGRTLGILGLGRMGSRVAQIGRAFGMQVIAWSQNLSPEKAAAGGAAYVLKEELFARADVLSIHLVLSARTRALVGAAELARMKPSAILVNVSRGPIVEERALLDALRAGRPGHAALDVYEREPLPADHPLRAMDNVTLSPHLGYVNADNVRTFYADTVENVEAWLERKPIRLLQAENAQ